MTCFKVRLAAPAILAVVLTACAEKPPGPPFDGAAADTHLGKTEHVAKPETKKPVRITGRGEITWMSLEQFFALQQSGKVLLFDARPAFFYQLGHIPGAANMPSNGCDQKIHDREKQIQAALAAGKHIVVYCTSSSCPDAHTLAVHFSSFGYPASVLTGGWDAWRDAGMPVE